MNIAIHFLWNLLVEEANKSWPRGFRAGNTKKSLKFVSALHSELAEEVIRQIGNTHGIVESRRYDPIVVHNCLEELDRKITSKMLAAEDGVSPSKTACSFGWSPDLVQIHQKANLLMSMFQVSKQPVTTKMRLIRR